MNDPLAQPTFLIHDYETFGKHPALDRPAQFAGIRVNSQFEILSKPEVFFCRPADDYLPDPEAVLITGITPQQALRNGVIEAEFARRIHQLFTVPDTCIIGYNNVRFDDEVSRNLFYRNFYDPYSWSWQLGNSRWDLLDVLRACYALRPDGITWPLNDKGLPSFRLKHLTNANRIEHDHSHDALADVYATLAMAKLMRLAQPMLFDYLYRHRGKHQLKTLINIETMKPLVYVSCMFDADRGYTAWIAPLAWHPNNKNALIACDLSGDMKVLENLDSDELRTRLYTQHSKLGDDAAVPLKLIHLNKCPILAPANTLRPTDAERLGIYRQRCLDNLNWLRNRPKVREKCVVLFAENAPFKPSNDVDAQLYSGFFSKEDRAAMNIIHATLPENLPALNISFFDPRLKPLLFRYRARNFPYTLDPDEQLRWLKHRKTNFTHIRIEAYVHQLEALYKIYKVDEQKKLLLRALFEYLQIF
ncbi:exodeoxyribonuclease I [Sodalis endosymbiont of Henestaris halophilus]|uniref:exodeoxyribonuclease I n=1 Tax=Sodalis endosymbiont of Henestaris halophilus TaxID=1929246 RepID=UPI000BBF98DB|nr:exodeoxyribonuclease I [Sodalis endosymbiont of Henestaris halophilus]SNC58970.1 Exodeoxyribonuclease I [Sodalis endosymbiont of Henestaris halophilus]